jgi:ADP-ribosylglycohydrolase
VPKITNLLLQVALDPEYLANPYAIALRTWVDSGRRNAANGSLMRTHPLGVMCVGRSLPETFQVAADMSRVTHVDPRCVLACCVATGLVRGLLRGEVLTEADVDALMEEAKRWVGETDDMREPGKQKEKEKEKEKGDEADVDSDDEKGGLDIAEFEKHVHAQTFGELQLDDSYKMGYVYKCLGVAVLALRMGMRQDPARMDTFEKIITEITMHGGDADTNACAAGALLGALLGYSRLPHDWREGISHGDWLVQKSEALSRVAGISQAGKGGDANANVDDPDTALDGGRGMLTKEQTDQRERDLIFNILTKQKERREAEESKKKQTFGKWVAGMVASK